MGAGHLPRIVQQRVSACRLVRFVTVALGAVLLVALAGPVRAQPSACDGSNLLAGRLPLGGTATAAAVATDGRLVPEGAPWDSPAAVALPVGAPALVWDLGSEREVRAFLVQADADDRYLLLGSLDGRSFSPLTTAGEVPELAGLVSRPLSIATQRLRFLRLEAQAGDGLYALAELQVYCRAPQPWPPRLPRVSPQAAGMHRRTTLWWNDESSRWWELLLALAGLALLLWDARLARQPAPSTRALRRKDRALAAAGVLAVLTYFNFGAFHFGSFVHGWDVFHYYVGSKYFRELGYERLYACVAVADAQEPGLGERVAARRITDLRTNRLVTGREVLADQARCRDRFSPARWAEFRHDVGWFRARETPQRWDAISSDHGYNATPVWTMLGSLLASSAPASDRQILLLTLVDPLYFLALLAVVRWAFGWRALAVALLAFATYFPSRFFWTGGAFLRWDWLFHTVAAVACLRRGRPLLGGLLLGYAALLRVFPGLLALGTALALARAAVVALRPGGAGAPGGSLPQRLRLALGVEPARSHLRFAAGMVLAVALLVPASLLVAGGDAYRGFVANSRKHAATPLTNNMGLRMAITYRPAEVGRLLVSDAAAEPWRAWKEARARAWERSRWPALALALGFVALLAVAVARHREPWIAPALGALAIPFVVDLTSYYYAFVLVPALLWSRRRLVGPLLLLLSAATTFVSLAPLPGMSTWRDEQYTLASVLTLLAFIAIALSFARRPPDPAAADAPSAPSRENVAPPRRARRRRRRGADG